MTDDEIKVWMPLINRWVHQRAGKLSRLDKEDLKQECALALLVAEDRIREALADSKSHAGRLVSRILKQKIIDVLRHQRRLIRCETLSDPVIAREAGRVIDPRHPGEEYPIPEKSLESLDYRDREFVRLRIEEDLPMTGVAKHFQISRPAAYRMERRTVKKLKKELTSGTNA